jgi:hypothetical protein
VWHALTNRRKRLARASTMVAGLTLAVLIFCYFFLWTGAAAWLACIGALWLYFRRSERWKTVAILTTISFAAVIALVPYIYLLSHRVATMNEQQTLISTHRPDLLRVHEILGAVILVALFIGVLRRGIEWSDSRVIYATSLALLPFVVFNQQILTGLTMQAFHFEIFVVNYTTLIGLLITATVLRIPLPRRLLIWTAALSFSWGVVVVGLPSQAFVPLAIANDRRIPVLLRLKELSKQDGTRADLRVKGQASTLVFSPSVSLITLLSTWTSQGTLIDIMGVYCRDVTPDERKTLFFMHLYYSKVDAEALREALDGTPNRFRDELSSVRTVLFGYQRVFPALSPQYTPVQQDEIEREVQAYRAYANSFSREAALRRPITYAVISVEGNFDFTNIDRWYERDAGERVGDYVLYRLKLRT